MIANTSSERRRSRITLTSRSIANSDLYATRFSNRFPAFFSIYSSFPFFPHRTIFVLGIAVGPRREKIMKSVRSNTDEVSFMGHFES